jgi:hypothetical protein
VFARPPRPEDQPCPVAEGFEHDRRGRDDLGRAVVVQLDLDTVLARRRLPGTRGPRHAPVGGRQPFVQLLLYGAQLGVAEWLGDDPQSLRQVRGVVGGQPSAQPGFDRRARLLEVERSGGKADPPALRPVSSQSFAYCGPSASRAAAPPPSCSGARRVGPQAGRRAAIMRL